MTNRSALPHLDKTCSPYINWTDQHSASQSEHAPPQQPGPPSKATTPRTALILRSQTNHSPPPLDKCRGRTPAGDHYWCHDLSQPHKYLSAHRTHLDLLQRNMPVRCCWNRAWLAATEGCTGTPPGALGPPCNIPGIPPPSWLAAHWPCCAAMTC